MHWIQKDILKKLSTAEKLRYKDLIPENVEGNLFMYHLKQLINEKYVEKENQFYKLSKQGKSYVGGLSLSTGKPTKFPRLLTLIFFQNKNGEILLYKWRRQPYLGHVSLPFNRIKYGESVFKTAEETLKYKTNLKGRLDYAGDAYVIVKKEDLVTTHYLAHIFILKNPKGELFADGLTGEPFWGKVDDYFGSDLVYGTKEIIKIIKNKKSPFFEEIIVTNI